VPAKLAREGATILEDVFDGPIRGDRDDVRSFFRARRLEDRELVVEDCGIRLGRVAAARPARLDARSQHVDGRLADDRVELASAPYRQRAKRRAFPPGQEGPSTITESRSRASTPRAA
jgi:hypothetical protein